MKRHGYHGKRKRYGAKQQARLFANGGKSELDRRDQKRKEARFRSDRREMIAGWLRVMARDSVFARVVEIYGREYAESLEFLK